MRMLSVVITLLLVALLATAAFATTHDHGGPAPRSLQLKIGVYAYGGSQLWQNDNSNATRLRSFAGERYFFIVGNPANNDKVDSIIAHNDSLRHFIYDLWVMQLEDTIEIYAWGVNHAGYDSVQIDSMFLITGPTSADSVRFRVNPSGIFGSTYRTTPGGGAKIIMDGFAGQPRVFADWRQYRKWGEWLGYFWTGRIDAVRGVGTGPRGVFIDEFSHIGATGRFDQTGVNAYPLRETLSDWWSTDWQNVYPRWDQSLSHDEVRDSTFSLILEAMRIAGDSLKSEGYLGMPNGASDWGPYRGSPNWEVEGIPISSALGVGAWGEYCYLYPTINSEWESLWRTRDMIRAYADSIPFFSLMQVSVGTDSSAADSLTIADTRMAALGFFLDCLVPGTDVWFSVHNNLYNNLYFDYADNDGTGDGQIEDTITNWDDAWGKYFGVPRRQRDSLLVIDAAGQLVQIYHFSLGKPGDTIAPQTLVVGRYPRNDGSVDNRRPSATAGFTLPPSPNADSSWFELTTGGQFLAGFRAGDVVDIQPVRWRFFVVDTVLASTGKATAPIDPSPSPARLRIKGFQR